MTKGKLLNYIDGGIVVAGKELSNAIEGSEIKYWEDKEKELKQIRSILNLHFSISDSERKEAAEWFKTWLPVVEKDGVCLDIVMHDKQLRVYQTALKALGEKPE